MPEVGSDCQRLTLRLSLRLSFVFAARIAGPNSVALLTEAGSLLRACVETGDARACTHLGRWHLFGIGGVDEDVEKAWEVRPTAVDAHLLDDV